MKLDFGKITAKWQKEWEKKGLAEAKPGKGKKFFLIFAYPGISGFLHVGHMRGFTYSDVITRFKRMQGFNVLFPVGFHASGLPAVAYAGKVQRKEENTIAQLKDYGLSEKKISELEQPEKVVEFFSKVYVNDFFRKFGYLIDESRLITTTGPEYGKFIEWQFKKLREKDLLVQKPHFGPACPQCGPIAIDAAETDLQQGGTAETLEYVALKFRAGEYILPAATLRAETVYGVTNLWVNPKAGLVVSEIRGEKWLLPRKSFEKLKYQWKGLRDLGKTVEAKELIGAKAKSLVTGEEIPILPSEFVEPSMGTGIVMGVPAHAPWDFIALKEAKENAKELEKQGVNAEELGKIEPVPLIDVPGFGKLPAKEICGQMKINSLSQREELEKATEESYKKEFHSGTLNELYGEMKGRKISEVKEEIIGMLVSRGKAERLLGFSEKVVCRCGKEAVIVSIPDQWFIKYGDKELTEKTKKHAEEMKIFPEQYKKELPGVLDWFKDRACVRQGNWLGTKFPFDEKWIIEPISDSTLYPLAYTFSNYVNSGKLREKHLTEEFFDYVFLGKGKTGDIVKKSKAKRKVVEEVKKEFEYWHPLDINLGGKEHKTVHFPVFLFNHVAVMRKEHWPKGIFVNWWVTGKSGKISKSKGGAESLHNLAERFSVDALRLYYCHAGSPFADIEFDSVAAEKYRKALERLANALENALTVKGPKDSGLDEWLKYKAEKRLQEFAEKMEEMDLRNSAEIVFFGLPKFFAWYRRRGGGNRKLAGELAEEWVKALAPFAPHLAEELWHSVLKKKSLVSAEKMNGFNVKENPGIEKGEELIEGVLEDVNYIKGLLKGKKFKKAKIIVAPEWKWKALEKVKKMGEREEKPGFREAMGKLMKEKQFKQRGKEMQGFLQQVMKKVNELEGFEKVDEFRLLQNASEFIGKEFGCEAEVEKAEKSKEKKASGAFPLKPAIVLE